MHYVATVETTMHDYLLRRGERQCWGQAAEVKSLRLQLLVKNTLCSAIANAVVAGAAGSAAAWAAIAQPRPTRWKMKPDLILDRNINVTFEDTI